MTEFKIIAKTFQGLEEVLAKELINLGANNVEIGRRMVAFTGDKEMLYRANACYSTARPASKLRMLRSAPLGQRALIASVIASSLTTSPSPLWRIVAASR